MIRYALLVATSVAALAASAAEAATFNFTGAIQTYVISQTGHYLVTAAGAQGGSINQDFAGGLGAQVSGRFLFQAGTTLQIVVGERGSTGISGGGGGGTFIFLDPATALAVAGGGGGAHPSSGGAAGLTSTAGGSAGAAGGTDGSGGDGAIYNGGGGGGGFFGDGGSSTGIYNGSGGTGGASGFGGGGGVYNGNGGFGGGGGGGYYGGGGGGGFSGGGGGTGYLTGGGGGGSFVAATASDVTLQSGVNSGNGFASIDAIAAPAVPEPSSWAMLIAGFGMVGSLLRRRRVRPA